MALVLALLVGTTARAGDEPKADSPDPKGAVSSGVTLLKEGDKLADAGDPTGAVVQYKKAFEALLPLMRKIPFKSEVKRDVTAREDMQAMLVKEIDSEMTPAEFRASELGMKAVGLLPAGVDLKAVMTKVYSEEIAAFYDTKTKTMHLIKEPEAKAKKPLTFLERLMGKTAGFDKDENKTVIAHELTHALADQNFDIGAMQKAIKDDDDRDLALSSLIEGEATLTMIGAQMEDWKGDQVGVIPAANLDRVFSFMMPFMPMAGGQALREAPVILSESMLFPYLRGMVFCARLTNDGGWEALNAAYRNPPQSTEQIIHPEKYRAKPDYPTAIDLRTLEPGDGWKELARNVVGEMQLAVLLVKHGGKPAAAGWDGDRFAVFEDAAGKTGLVWLTTWDTLADAAEFQFGYARFQATKIGAEAKTPDSPPDKLVRKSDRASYAVERRGNDVAIVEGFSEETTERLLDAVFKSKKTDTTPADLKK